MQKPMKLVRAGERGLVLVMVMIVLVAMMFAGVAMLRSVDTANLVAGNMSFRQAATHQGDYGIEYAIQWLTGQNCTTCTALQSDNTSLGYNAILRGPAAGVTWDTYWTSQLDPSPISRPVSTPTNSGNVYTLATANGYTVSYVIHRMCSSSGASSSGCLSSPTAGASGVDSKMAGKLLNAKGGTGTYYRITSRIEGPRNTVSYVQAVVSM